MVRELVMARGREQGEPPRHHRTAVAREAFFWRSCLAMADRSSGVSLSLLRAMNAIPMAVASFASKTIPFAFTRLSSGAAGVVSEPGAAEARTGDGAGCRRGAGSPGKCCAGRALAAPDVTRFGISSWTCFMAPRAGDVVAFLTMRRAIRVLFRSSCCSSWAMVGIRTLQYARDTSAQGCLPGIQHTCSGEGSHAES